MKVVSTLTQQAMLPEYFTCPSFKVYKYLEGVDTDWITEKRHKIGLNVNGFW